MSIFRRVIQPPPNQEASLLSRLASSLTPSPLSLHRYFGSGWAFLIPYLAAYLLYAWLKWPVNPVGSDSPSSGIFRPPCLLHVYWFLHGVHLLLSILALRSWWQSCASNENGNWSTNLPATHSPLLTVAYRAIPWLCLALVFWIPGIYLEWPSDPWEHLRRINEWHILDQVANHSVWKKSSYFLPYSLTGHFTGIVQLSWLNAYYTTICLLLSWQYYQLARVVGLGKHASFIFVLVNALTFGNNIFSFYRYYGLSSSIFAQLAAVALTRITLEHLGCSQTTPKNKKYRAAIIYGINNLYPPQKTRKSPLQFGGATLALFVLIALNHVQGLGIAGLGILAVIVWRLIEWKRSMIGWLALAAFALSAAGIMWVPRNPALDGAYRTQGWLTVWYGFNLFTPSSPAFDRSFQILGVFGVLGLVPGLWIIVRRNHIAGWLTLIPVLALALPCIALPFAHAVAASIAAENINIFHRMLLAVPTGLTLAAVLSRSQPACALSVDHAAAPTPSPVPTSWMRNAYPLLCIGLVSAVVLPPGATAYNHFWQSIQTGPDDLQLRHVIKFLSTECRVHASNTDTLTISHPSVSEIDSAFQPGPYRNSSRLADASVPIRELTQQLDLFDAVSSNFDRPSPNQHISWSDQLLLQKQESHSPTARVISNPTSTSAPWITLGGAAPQEVLLAPHRLSIRNPIGSVSYPFSPELTPISRYHRYQLTCRIRQSGAPGAINYLAVAWYDKSGNLLTSNLPFPRGAGRPTGWNNGTFSYFGLVGRPAAAEWTSYSVSFGLGEPATIPVNAAFLRIGAMLNFNGEAEASAELTDVRLVESDLQHRLLLSMPSLRDLYTPASPAARLSGHWTPQYVPAMHVGITEMRAHF